MNSSPTDLTPQKQPTPVTCVQTCLAMALNEPVEKVIEVFGPNGMSQQELASALHRCGVTFNCLVFGTLVSSGWYFLKVPSLNNVAGSHMVLVHYDAGYGCSGFHLLDPSTMKTYDTDGKNLGSWSDPIIFIPGGCLP